MTSTYTRASRFVAGAHEVALVRSRAATLDVHAAVASTPRATLCGFPVSGRAFAERPSAGEVGCPVCSARLEALS